MAGQKGGKVIAGEERRSVRRGGGFVAGSEIWGVWSQRSVSILLILPFSFSYSLIDLL